MLLPRLFKRLPMRMYYPLVALLVAAGVGLFALFYSGAGASLLAMGEVYGEQQTTSPAPGEAGPTPGPAGAVSTSGRLLAYQENGGWGFKNTGGEVAIPAKFREVQEFAGDVAFARDLGGLYGLIDRSGVWVREPTWSAVRPFSNGRAAVEKDGAWGYIDDKGALVVEYQFREAGEYACGRARVRTGSYWGYIDAQGSLAVAATWLRCYDYAEDIAFAVGQKNGRDCYYLIDKLGTKVATLGSSVAGERYSEGFAAVRENGKYYYYNNAGRSAFSASFEEARAFSNGMAAVKDNGLWGYINQRGAMVIEPQYAQAGDFSGGYAAVQDAQTKLWGYIGKTGNQRLPMQFEAAQPFSGGVALVTHEGNACFTDTAGNILRLY